MFRRLGVPRPIEFRSIQDDSGLRCVVEIRHISRKDLDAGRLFRFPSRVGVSDALLFGISMQDKANAIAHLRHRSVSTEVPNRSGKNITAEAQKGRKVVGLVPPMSQVRAAWSAAHSMSVH